MHPSDLPAYVDILVVGSGAAGLYAALSLPQQVQVGLITKDTLTTGSSTWAQGGIAAAIAPGDSPQLHLADTLSAGAGLSDQDAVAFLVTHAPAAIDALVEMGVAFDRTNNQLAMTLEAAHSRPRVLHSADTTGRAIVDTLTRKVLDRQNITVLAQALALSLWLDPHTGACQGIGLLYQGQIRWIRASAVVLATGGGGQVYAQTTNPAVSTGDGVAIAWRAGAILRDLEFFQFHPTALTQPGAPRFLISEAVRGEGAYLVDEQGDRFAFAYHPQGELAPRDVVSRAIFTHLQQTAADPAQAHVYLDLAPIAPEQIRHRFPNIIKVCQQWGIDVLHQPIPVAPAAHYWMGGVATDLRAQTSISRLYAIGEAASTGVHGANRLASNSLLECLVFTAQLAQIPLQSTCGPEPSSCLHYEAQHWAQDLESLQKLRQQLPRLMWQSAGICRDGEQLQGAIAQVQSWRTLITPLKVVQYLETLKPDYPVMLEHPEAETQLRIAAETLNLLDIAGLMLKSALYRTESRGGHYRSDFPETISQWQVHTLVQGDRWWTAPVHSPSGEE